MVLPFFEDDNRLTLTHKLAGNGGTTHPGTDDQGVNIRGNLHVFSSLMDRCLAVFHEPTNLTLSWVSPMTNLYVCDANVFPKALDRPTVITIAALVTKPGEKSGLD
jgi:hypothetical protein